MLLAPPIKGLKIWDKICSADRETTKKNLGSNNFVGEEKYFRREILFCCGGIRQKKLPGRKRACWNEKFFVSIFKYKFFYDGIRVIISKLVPIYNLYSTDHMSTYLSYNF